MPAGSLAEGDRLLGEHGEWITVEEVLDTGDHATLYNLRIADWHTYFVGQESWGWAAWAHNRECSVTTEKRGDKDVHVLRDPDGNEIASGDNKDALIAQGKALDAERAASDVPNGRYRGGCHADMSGPHTVGDQLDSHHMPDRRANPAVHPDDGPSIQMDPPDHHETSSNGRHGEASRAWRAETAQMIHEGRYRDAMAREIRDVRRAASVVSNDPTKYNEAILEMLDYARRSAQLPRRR